MEFKIQTTNPKFIVHLNDGEQVTVDKNLLDALPDMLEALEAAKNALINEGRRGGVVMEQINAAIKKARGQS